MLSPARLSTSTYRSVRCEAMRAFTGPGEGTQRRIALYLYRGICGHLVLARRTNELPTRTEVLQVWNPVLDDLVAGQVEQGALLHACEKFGVTAEQLLRSGERWEEVDTPAWAELQVADEIRLLEMARGKPLRPPRWNLDHIEAIAFDAIQGARTLVAAWDSATPGVARHAAERMPVAHARGMRAIDADRFPAFSALLAMAGESFEDGVSEALGWLLSDKPWQVLGVQPAEALVARMAKEDIEHLGAALDLACDAARGGPMGANLATPLRLTVADALNATLIPRLRDMRAAW